MADVNANINIDINSSEAIAGLKRLQSQINAFQRTVSAGNTAAAAQQAAINRALLDGINATGMFTAKQVDAVSSAAKFTNALEKNKLSLGEYTRYAASQLPGLGRVFRREFQTMEKVAVDRVKAINTQYLALGKTVDGVTKTIAAVPDALNRGYGTEIAIAAQRQQMFNKLIDDGSTKLLNWGKNTQWAGRQLMVGLSLPMAAFGAAAAAAFMELDKATVQLKRVYGDLSTTTAEVDANAEAIKALGAEYTKYGIAVSDTIALGARAAATGATNETLLAATEQTLRFATLGQIDYNQALDTTISLQTAFGVSNDDLAQKIDFLNAVENQTILTIEDMSLAIPRVATVVKGLGGDVEDLAIMMTAMREGGVSAENAANGLKSGLASMINPTNRAKEMLKGFGINLEEIVKQYDGDLLGTIIAFGEELDKLSDLDRQRSLEKVFGKYQYARMSALFDNMISKSGQAARAMDLAGYSARELSIIAERELGVISESTTVKFQAAMEALKLAIAPLGEAFLKVATPAVEMITKIANAFNELPDSIKNAIGVATIAIAGIGPVLLMGIGLMGNLVANIIKGIQWWRKLGARIRGEASAFDYMTKAELDAMAATEALESSSNSLTSSLGLQAKAVSALTQEYGRFLSVAGRASGAMGSVPAAGGRGRGRAPIKRARGGIVPGSGNGDIIPALLEPGETVVTKEASQRFGPVLAAMNAGTLPGYQNGLNLPGVRVPEALGFAKGSKTTQAIEKFFKEIESMPGAVDKATEVLEEFANKGEKITKGQFMDRMIEAGYGPRRGLPDATPARAAAHLTKRRSITEAGMEWLATRTGRGEGGRSVTAQNILSLAKDPATAEFVKEYSGLTADLSQTLNTQLQTGAAVADFNKEWAAEGSRLLPSLERFGGFVVEGADDLKALSTFEQELAQRVNSRADVIKTGIVTDEILEQETRALISQYKSANTSMGKVARAADTAASTIAQVSIAMSEAQAEQLVAQGMATKVDTGKETRYISSSGAVLGRKSATDGTWRPERYGRLARRTGASMGSQSVAGARAAVGAASPAEEFAEVMDDAAEGMLVGAKRSSKTAAKSGEMLAQSAQAAYKAEMSQLRRDIRNDDFLVERGVTDPVQRTRTLKRAKRAQDRRSQVETGIARKEKARRDAEERRARKDADRQARREERDAQKAASARAERSARQRRRIGRGIGAVGGGLGALSLVPFMAQDEQGKFMGMNANMLGMGMMGASMLAPLAKGAFTAGGALAGLAGPLAIVGGVALAAGLAIKAWRENVDEASRKASDLGANLGGAANALNTMASMKGMLTPAQRQARIQLGVSEEDLQASYGEFAPMLESEAGQKFIEDLKSATSAERFKKLADYLQSAVAGGIMSVAEAGRFAEVVGTSLGDAVMASIAKQALLGQGTGAVAYSELAARREKEVGTSQAAIELEKAVKAAEEVLERYGPVSVPATQYTPATTVYPQVGPPGVGGAGARSGVNRGARKMRPSGRGARIPQGVPVYKDEYGVYYWADAQGNPIRSNVEPGKAPTPQQAMGDIPQAKGQLNYQDAAFILGGSIQVLQDYANVVALAKEDLAAERITRKEYNRIIKDAAAKQKQYTENIFDAIANTTDFGATMQAVDRQLLALGMTAEDLKLIQESLGDGLTQQQSATFYSEIASATAQGMSASDIALITKYVLQEAPQGAAAGAFKNEQYRGQSYQLAGLAMNIESGMIPGLGPDQAQQVIDVGFRITEQGGSIPEYYQMLMNIPPELRTTVITDFEGMGDKELLKFNKSFNDITNLGNAELAVSILFDENGKPITGKELTTTTKATTKALEDLKSGKTEVEKKAVVTLFQEIIGPDGSQMTVDQAGVAYDELLKNTGLTEGQFITLPADIVSKLVVMQAEVRGIEQMIAALKLEGDALIASGWISAGSAKHLQAAQLQKQADAIKSDIKDTAESGLKPTTTKQTTPSGSGSGAAKKEDPFKTLKSTIINQIKMFTDANAKISDLIKGKQSFFKLLNKNNGIDDQIRRAGLSPAMTEYLMGLDPKDAKKILGRITNKKGRLTGRGRLIDESMMIGQISQTMTGLRDRVAGARAQERATADLMRRGAGADAINAIGGDPKMAQEYVFMLDKANEANKRYQNALKKAEKDGKFSKTEQQNVAKLEKEWLRASSALNNYINLSARAAIDEQASAKRTELAVEQQKTGTTLQMIAEGVSRGLGPEALDEIANDPGWTAIYNQIKTEMMSPDPQVANAAKAKYNEFWSSVEQSMRNTQAVADAIDPIGAAVRKLDQAREPILRNFAVLESQFKKRFGELEREYAPKLKASKDTIKSYTDQIQKVEDEIRVLERLNQKDQNRIRTLNEQKEVLNRQVETYDRQNEADQRRADALSRQAEMINRQIESLERQNEIDQRIIDNLQREDELRNRTGEAIDRELELMSRQEQRIREVYDQRIKALEEVEDINERIAQQQQDQIDLSQSLVQGDIFAAARAAQQMRDNQIADARERQRQALQQGMENQIGGMRTSGGLTRQQAEEQLLAIQDQSYQTQLMIRDVQDEIYNRNLQSIPLRDQIRTIEDQVRVITDNIYNTNLLIIPIKDDIRAIDDDIREINDLIYGRESEILKIQQDRLQPLRDSLELEQRNLTKQEEALENAKAAVRFGGMSYDELQNRMAAESELYELQKAQAEANLNNNKAIERSVYNIRDAWNRVIGAIETANRTARTKTENAIKDYQRELAAIDKLRDAKKITKAEAQSRIQAAQNTRNTAIAAAEAERQAAIAAAQANGAAAIGNFNKGGVIPGYASGYVSGDGGRDSVLARLTPGEVVIRKSMVDKYGLPFFADVNNGSFVLPEYNVAQPVTVGANTGQKTVAEGNSAVYNTYSVNVNVPNANVNADEVANKVLYKIRQIDSGAVRSYRGF